MIFDAISGAIGKVLDKVIPDANQAAEVKLRYAELLASGELKALEADLQIALAQAKINEVEAAGDLFRGGWRPGAGWVCVAALAYQFLLQPLLQPLYPCPPLDVSDLMTLLMGMLGLGGFRTYEKLKGASR